jgi:hypothetical protein
VLVEMWSLKMLAFLLDGLVEDEAPPAAFTNASTGWVRRESTNGLDIRCRIVSKSGWTRKGVVLVATDGYLALIYNRKEYREHLLANSFFGCRLRSGEATPF